MFYVPLQKRNCLEMKPYGSKAECEKERNNELITAYHKLLDDADYICTEEIYRKVVNMPTSRFFVSEERAAIVISKLMRGCKLKGMRPTKREMFREIYRRAMLIRKKKPNMPVYDLAFEVVRQPAPKFYMEPGYARYIIFTNKKKWYEERKRKLRHLF